MLFNPPLNLHAIRTCYFGVMAILREWQITRHPGLVSSSTRVVVWGVRLGVGRDITSTTPACVLPSPTLPLGRRLVQPTPPPPLPTAPTTTKMSEHNSPNAESKPKPADDNTLNIKIRATDSSEVFFKIKKTTKLNKLKVGVGRGSQGA